MDDFGCSTAYISYVFSLLLYGIQRMEDK